jgi:signal transduction protein with GAF and PtsI domain
LFTLAAVYLISPRWSPDESAPEEREATMIVGISEEATWRCEVIAQSEGYLVQVRDLETSALEEPMLFRTAVAALAYGDFLAAVHRTAAARLLGDETDDLEAEVERLRAAFGEVADHLVDRGIDLSALVAWRDYEESRPRHRLH